MIRTLRVAQPVGRSVRYGVLSGTIAPTEVPEACTHDTTVTLAGVMQQGTHTALSLRRRRGAQVPHDKQSYLASTADHRITRDPHDRTMSKQFNILGICIFVVHTATLPFFYYTQAVSPTVHQPVVQGVGSVLQHSETIKWKRGI